MNKNIDRQISLVPLTVLNAVCEQAGLKRSNDKATQVLQVASLIDQGLITLDQVKATIPSGNTAAPAAPAAPDATLDAGWQRWQQQRLDAITLTLNEAFNNLKGAEADILSISSKVADVELAVRKSLIEVEGRLVRQLSTVSVDEGKLDKAISGAVSKAFRKFRTEVPVRRIKEIASGLRPQTETSTAAEVFGADACRYGETDFGSLNVEVWSHPDAPQVVDDYVFDARHLHQAIIALSDDIPDNLWLAGERGTGKTEFATQIAARLQRPLYRVNFDEALERADFIGANTIEAGNVVWKAGIIAQAIQVPGAIILLDEIGFARAQSLAVLHSLCERSPHRALTVNETGVRIPVATDVAFLCADNSNGHGDASGNFAGVREQNSAFIDRFSFTLQFQYLPQDAEAKLISQRTGVNDTVARAITTFAKVAREKSSAGLLSQPPSLRQLFAWARAVHKGLPVQVAFFNAIVNKFPIDCTAELAGIYAATINQSDFGGAQ